MSTRTPHLTDRKEAGLLLASRLLQFQDTPRTLVLALPRGGVEVGFMISTQLRLPLNVLLTRKLGYPGNPEYAMGAITETGFTWFNPDASDMAQRKEFGFQQFLDNEIARQQREIERQQALYRLGRTLPSLDRYTIILVDDGIATGSTFMVSIHALRTFPINRLIGAIPVGPPDTIKRIRPLVDHLEVLHIVDGFFSVGAHYQHFPQVEDEQVIQTLRTAQQRFPDYPLPSFTE